MMKSFPPTVGQIDGVKHFQRLFQPLDFLDACVLRYGETFAVGKHVFMSNPSALRAIFTATDALFIEGSDTMRPLLGPHSLLSIDGARHRQLRQYLAPPLHRKQIRDLGPKICTITQEEIERWPLNVPIHSHTTIRSLTLHVIGHVLFGSREKECQPICHAFASALDHAIGSPLKTLLFRINRRDLPWSPWRAFLRKKSLLDSLIKKEIQYRRQYPTMEQSDVLGLMLSLEDESGRPALTDEEVHDQVITLLAAGHETTASSIEWALYWLDRTPQVKATLLQELAAVDCNAVPDTIDRLPYLTAIGDETRRLYPMVPLAQSRVVQSHFEWGGYTFERGTNLVPCIYLTHQREDIYPEPKRFWPERFLHLERGLSAYEYLPFGGGNRRCLGAALAQYETKLILATIVSRLQITFPTHHLLSPVSCGLAWCLPIGTRIVVTVK